MEGNVLLLLEINNFTVTPLPCQTKKPHVLRTVRVQSRGNGDRLDTAIAIHVTHS